MDSNLDELKKEAVVDNSKLEEIMKKEITTESQRDCPDNHDFSRLVSAELLNDSQTKEL